MEKLIFSPQALKELEEKRNEIANRGTVCKADILMLRENINMEEFTSSIEINRYTSVRSKVGVSTLLEEIDTLIKDIKTNNIVNYEITRDEVEHILNTIRRFQNSCKDFNNLLNNEEYSNIIDYITNKEQCLYYYKNNLTDMSKLDISKFTDKDYVEYIKTLINSYKTLDFNDSNLNSIINKLSSIDYLQIQNSNLIKSTLLGKCLDPRHYLKHFDSIDKFSMCINYYTQDYNNSTINNIPSLQDIIKAYKSLDINALVKEINELDNNLVFFMCNTLKTEKESTSLYNLYKDLLYFKSFMGNLNITCDILKEISNVIEMFK